MTDQHSVRDLAHRVTHRIPGVPAHTEHPAGHQGRAHHGTTHQGRAWHPAAHDRSHGDRRNHSPARRPRVLAAWQRRIAAFFGQELR